MKLKKTRPSQRLKISKRITEIALLMSKKYGGHEHTFNVLAPSTSPEALNNEHSTSLHPSARLYDRVYRSVFLVTMSLSAKRLAANHDAL